MKLENDYKRKLQLRILDIVKDIDNLCKENNIDYYIAYGSCLGAVRHKGFIPWDDDFDIAITYDNYIKFLDICEKKLDKNKYYVQTPEKEENYYLSFSKIRDISTTLIENGNKDVDIVRSVYVDVFPIVGVPKSRLKEGILKINRAFMLSANKNVINNKALKKIFDVILKILGRKRILKYTTKKCFKYSCNNCDYWVSIADGDGYEQCKLKKEIYGRPKYVVFEDTKLPIPEKAADYLKKIYGDYMKIPSKEQIKAKEHVPYFLDFNLPYSKYILENKKKKKILFIIWSFSYGGGAERILANIVNNLNEKKYDIDLLEYYHTDINKEKVNDNINLLDPIVDFRDNKLKKLISMMLLKTFPMVLKKIYIQKKYDLEISFNYLIPTFLLSDKAKSIAWIHGDIYDLKYNRINRALQRRSLKNVDKIVSISENTYNSIIEVFPEYKEKLLIINNGIDLNSMIEKSTMIKLKKEKKKTILFINRYDDNKNPLFAIDVAKKLNELGYDFQMNFIGKGELESCIREKIKQYKLEKNIKILGYQKNPYPYIKNCDIVIGCSKSEGFPTIFIEAITFGKPFVTTSVGGAREISGNGYCGLIAETFDEYVEKLRILLDDKEKYKVLSNNALEHSKKFSIENYIIKIEKLIDDLLGDRNDEI